MKVIKAKDIYDYAVKVLASSQWPVSRAVFGGIRLRQITDAIKISAAQFYCDELKGLLPKGRYESMKKNFGVLIVSIPDIFIRNEDWEEIQLIENEEKRKVELMTSGLTKYHSEKLNNEEEKEILEDETFDSFSAYLERLPIDYPYIMPHMLGHLSRRYIYTDDIIPIFETNPFEGRDP